jgi:hypothetical protein
MKRAKAKEDDATIIQFSKTANDIQDIDAAE